jgi:hypothetical protein
VPTLANTRLSPLSTFSIVVVLAARRPLWRSQRSERKERSRNTVVTQDPAMKSGLRDCAPTSLM